MLCTKFFVIFHFLRRKYFILPVFSIIIKHMLAFFESTVTVLVHHYHPFYPVCITYCCLLNLKDAFRFDKLLSHSIYWKSRLGCFLRSVPFNISLHFLLLFFVCLNHSRAINVVTVIVWICGSILEATGYHNPPAQDISRRWDCCFCEIDVHEFVRHVFLFG